jgi:hypothetical protein
MMIRQLYIASALSLFVLALTFGYTASAQNVTTNASNATGNASAATGNASAGLNQTASEIGKNASEVGGQILNKTEEVGKGLAGGLGSLLGNASEKLKESSK